MGVKSLTKVQFGKETTHGTAVAADTILLCTLDLPDADRTVQLPEVDYGGRIVGHSKNAIQRHVGVDATLEDADGCYFELLPILLNMCLKGGVTGAEQTTGQSDYLFTFTAPNSGAETVDTGTFEVGDDNQGYEFSYGLGKGMTLSWDAASGEVHCSMDLKGNRLIQTTVTASQTVPDVEFMDGKICQLWIDDSWASRGTTTFSDTLVSGELNIMGGVHEKYLGGSTRLYTAHNQGRIDATLTLTVERNAAVKAEELHFRPAADYTPDMRCVRVQITGDQIASGDIQLFQLDMTGVWESWEPFGAETDGNNHDVIRLRLGKDDTSGSDSLEILTTTTISAI